MKAILKKNIKKIMVNSKAIRLGSHFAQPGVLILRYHSVLDTPGKLDDMIGCGIVHSSELFEQQMKEIEQNYTPVSMDDVFDFTNGMKEVPKRAVAVTFDDGFADNSEIAAPIMNNYGVKGAIYVTTSCIAPENPPWFVRLRRAFHLSSIHFWKSPVNGIEYDFQYGGSRQEALLGASSDCAVLKYDEQEEWLNIYEKSLGVEPFDNSDPVMMNEQQIKQLRAYGHIVGSHTVSHPNTAYIDNNELMFQLTQSKERLEGILGEPVTHFSYPSPILQPHYNENTTAMLKEAGYATAVTCNDGLVLRNDSPLSYKRIVVPDDIGEFKWRLEAYFSRVK